MSVNTATAKRVSRTLRASPSKSYPTSSNNGQRNEDIENLSAVTLAALGLPPPPAAVNKNYNSISSNNMGTPQQNGSSGNRDRTTAMKRMSKTSNDMYATPPPSSGITSRTISSSSNLSTSTNNTTTAAAGAAGNGGRPRDRDRSVSSSSDMLGPHHITSGSSAPLTAIRRPSQQVVNPHNSTGSTPLSNSKTAMTSGISNSKNSPASARQSSSNGNSNTAAAIRSKRGSTTLLSGYRDTPPSSRTPSGHARVSTTSTDDNTSKQSRCDYQTRQDTHGNGTVHAAEEVHSTTAHNKGFIITQEEYSSLVALLSAKDEQIASLNNQVEQDKVELVGLKDKSIKLQKEKDVLISDKKELMKEITTASTNDEGTTSSSSGGGGGISKREFDKFKKQYEMQENLLEGFQRENEKATVEIDSLKKREKLLTEQLKKIYGPTFAIETDLIAGVGVGSPFRPDGHAASKRYPSSLSNLNGGPSSPLNIGNNGSILSHQHHRRTSGFGLASRSSPLISEMMSTTGNNEAGQEINQVTEVAVERKEIDSTAIMEQLCGVQALLERFEKRLLVRESELIKKEKEANEQVEKLNRVVVA